MISNLARLAVPRILLNKQEHVYQTRGGAYILRSNILNRIKPTLHLAGGDDGGGGSYDITSLSLISSDPPSRHLSGGPLTN